ncbi:hypothetical protein ACQJBY_027347 [Aegilops geniculata]
MQGVPHHQGSSNLFEYGDNLARHNKKEVPPVFELYAMAHTASYKKAKAFSESDLDHPESFTNISSHNKLVRYRDVGKTRKGEDFNPSQSPFDPELVMISSGERYHGSVAIEDGLIRCPRTLPEIKKRQTSSDPEITPRPWPMELAIEARAQELLAEANRQAVERERDMEEKTARLLEEERNRNSASHRSLYELLMSMCQSNGQTPPPMPQIGIAPTH